MTQAQTAADEEMQELDKEQRRDLAHPPVPLNPFGVARPLSNVSAEVASAREVADVQAAMVIARRFPRDQIAAMDQILIAFTRPTLAETALYEYSRGGTDVTGLSIRAAEAIAQQWGHIQMGVRELEQRRTSEGVGESTIEAFAFDAQTGTRDSRVFKVKHWRDTKKGGYKIEDSRDIYELVANLAARRKRQCILTVIPGDVQEAVKKQVEVTLKSRVEITPELLKSLAEKFAEFGVTVPAIERRIQRRMEAITPGLVVQLGKIFNSLKDGMSQPADWFELDAPANQRPEGAEEPAAPSKSGTAALRDRAKAAKPADTAPGATYAQVRDALEKATDGDSHNLAVDMIRSVTDEAQRAELVKFAAEKAKERANV